MTRKLRHHDRQEFEVETQGRPVALQAGFTFEDQTSRRVCYAAEHWARTMSYNKKDEDDGAVVKVDRTSVFQEGKTRPLQSQTYTNNLLTAGCNTSSCLQYVSSQPTEMSHPTHQDCPAPLHRREVPDQRGHLPLLWHVSARHRLAYCARSSGSTDGGQDPSCFRTRMPRCGRWSTWSSRSWRTRRKTSSWLQAVS